MHSYLSQPQNIHAAQTLPCIDMVIDCMYSIGPLPHTDSPADVSYSVLYCFLPQMDCDCKTIIIAMHFS